MQIRTLGKDLKVSAPLPHKFAEILQALNLAPDSAC